MFKYTFILYVCQLLLHSDTEVVFYQAGMSSEMTVNRNGGWNSMEKLWNVEIDLSY